MTEERVLRLMGTGDPLFAGAAGLFDEYRQHYGANPAPEAVTTWLTELVLSGRARIYVAGTAGAGTAGAGAAGAGTAGAGAVRTEGCCSAAAAAVGICSVAVVPAALTLRTVWLIRDLYVTPRARRRGVARALMATVAEEARSAGAHRLSLRTETANRRAIDLYADHGFEVLTDIAIMERML